MTEGRRILAEEAGGVLVVEPQERLPGEPPPLLSDSIPGDAEDDRRQVPATSQSAL